MLELLKALGEELKTIVLKIIQFFRDIFNWFKRWKSLTSQDKEIINFTLKKQLESGEYNVVRGIFDKNKWEIVDGNQLCAPRIDEELENAHRGKELVVYE